MHGATLGKRTMIDLEEPECLRLLEQAGVGRVALVDGDQPLALPVRYAVHEGTVVFMTVSDGALHRAAGSKVGFEVDDFDLDRSSGWSVLVRGRAEVVGDPQEVDALDALDLVPWLPALSGRRWVRDPGRWEPVGDRVWIRLRPEGITGRRTAPARSQHR
jgi:uncharacterized protein